MDLAEFLLFCKNYEVPLSSKSQLTVYRKVVDRSYSKQTGMGASFTRHDFKDALKLLFHEVHR